MAWFILAQIFSVLITLVSLGRLSEREKDLEILVLRQQLAILKRKQGQPAKPNRAEKMTLALLTAKLKEATQRPASRLRDITHDNDGKFTTAFDTACRTVFNSESVRVIPTPHLAPNADAYAERWVRTAREECLDHILILNIRSGPATGGVIPLVLLLFHLREYPSQTRNDLFSIQAGIYWRLT
jgi:hypothetical protein